MTFFNRNLFSVYPTISLCYMLVPPSYVFDEWMMIGWLNGSKVTTDHLTDDETRSIKSHYHGAGIKANFWRRNEPAVVRQHLPAPQIYFCKDMKLFINISSAVSNWPQTHIKDFSDCIRSIRSIIIIIGRSILLCRWQHLQHDSHVIWLLTCIWGTFKWDRK